MTVRSQPPELTVLHRIPSGSNAVYRCVDAGGAGWVYKPSAGERPLFDFPEGSLAAREIAAYVVSAALGWDLVPETVEAYGPGGPGMAQRWVEEARDDDGTAHAPVDVYPVGSVPEGRAAILRGEGPSGEELVVTHALTPRIRRVALFDLVINNADRKGGHLLEDCSGVPWAIDHGLSFHTDPKLRTVLWGWAGSPILDEDLADLDRFQCRLEEAGALRERLIELVTPDEIETLSTRVRALIDDGVFPVPGTGYPLPWPLF